MSTTISVGTTSGTAFNVTPDTSGNLAFQTQAGANTITVPNATGTIMVSGNMPAFSAYPSATTTLTQYVATKITYGTEEYDTNNNFASSRFTPTVAGYYQINASNSLASASALTYIYIYKNGSAYKSGNLVASSNWTVVSCQVYLNGSTDYIEVYVQQNSATQTNDTTSTNNYFQGCLIRAA